MVSWQVDCYRRPLRDGDGNPLWELLVCSVTGDFTYGDTCPQSCVSADWVTAQLTIAIQRAGGAPSTLQVFRPQTEALVAPAASRLNLSLQSTRHTPALKRWLVQRAAWYPSLPTYTGDPYDPLALDQPPPVPVPEHLWGEQWQFAAMSSTSIEALTYEPIPIKSQPLDLMPLNLGLASTTPIPGVVIEGGRQAMALALWLEQQQPAALNYRAGNPDGLILEAGLVDRWILATFDDPEVTIAGQRFQTRQQDAQGLHFLLVRPDNSGMTYSGFWLLGDRG